MTPNALKAPYVLGQVFLETGSSQEMEFGEAATAQVCRHTHRSYTLFWSQLGHSQNSLKRPNLIDSTISFKLCEVDVLDVLA